MKKILILTAALLTGGLTLSASAQRIHVNAHVQVPASAIFISGYQSCGTPVYSTRVYYGNRYQTRALTYQEVHYHRHYLQRLAVANPCPPRYQYRPVHRPVVIHPPVHRYPTYPVHRYPVHGGTYCR